MDNDTLGAAKAFTRKTVIGLGAIKGAPCTVQNVKTDTSGNSVVTLQWTGTDGTKQTRDVTIQRGKDGRDGENGNDGISVKGAVIRDNHLVIILSDDTEIREELENKADSADVGDLSELSTTDKSSVVAAINETNVNLGVLEGKVDIKISTTPAGFFGVSQNAHVTMSDLISKAKENGLISNNGCFDTSITFATWYAYNVILEANSWINLVGCTIKFIGSNTESIKDTYKIIISTSTSEIIYDVANDTWQELATMDKLIEADHSIDEGRILEFNGNLDKGINYKNGDLIFIKNTFGSTIPASAWYQLTANKGKNVFSGGELVGLQNSTGIEITNGKVFIGRIVRSTGQDSFIDVIPFGM